MKAKKQKSTLSVHKARNNGKVKTICGHDYKNAIQIGNADYVCPLCKELLDPME